MEYNEHAIGIIRGGKRDLYLAIRDKEHPYPVLLAYDPHTEEFAAVNIKGQNIATYFNADNEGWNNIVKKHEVMIALPKEVQKWIPFINI